MSVNITTRFVGTFSLDEDDPEPDSPIGQPGESSGPIGQPIEESSSPIGQPTEESSGDQSDEGNQVTEEIKSWSQERIKQHLRNAALRWHYELDNQRLSPTTRVALKSRCLLFQFVLRDTTTKIVLPPNIEIHPSLTVGQYFDIVCDQLIMVQILLLWEVWVGTKVLGGDVVQSSSDKKGGGRTKEDKAVQSDVVAWYGGHCVLSDSLFAQGAHIVAVHFEALPNARLQRFWATLNMFWPNEKVKAWRDELETERHQWRNILPLNVNAHYLWDRFYLAIRPIRHRKHPEDRMYVQLAWLDEPDDQHGIKMDHTSISNNAIVDLRSNAGDNIKHRLLQTGDVFEICTRDPKTYPLPSIELLELQWAMHKVMYCLKARGSLELIFSQQSPDTDHDAAAELEVPEIWDWLIGGAVGARVLSQDDAYKWRCAFAPDAEELKEVLEMEKLLDERMKKLEYCLRHGD